MITPELAVHGLLPLSKPPLVTTCPPEQPPVPSPTASCQSAYAMPSAARFRTVELMLAVVSQDRW
ncbi:hypothetical protein [Micromonospora musae]|uniref:hypothetical protein n=1 Tax=Micromonospora musae TaxID=1894970 RepID=UPI003405C898